MLLLIQELEARQRTSLGLFASVLACAFRCRSSSKRALVEATGLLTSGHEIVREDGELTDEARRITRCAGPVGAYRSAIARHGNDSD
jgi:hypothetical protein